jgi:hypothetical protein
MVLRLELLDEYRLHDRDLVARRCKMVAWERSLRAGRREKMWRRAVSGQRVTALACPERERRGHGQAMVNECGFERCSIPLEKSHCVATCQRWKLTSTGGTDEDEFVVLPHAAEAVCPSVASEVIKGQSR